MKIITDEIIRFDSEEEFLMFLFDAEVNYEFPTTKKSIKGNGLAHSFCINFEWGDDGEWLGYNHYHKLGLFSNDEREFPSHYPCIITFPNIEIDGDDPFEIFTCSIIYKADFE